MMFYKNKLDERGLNSDYLTTFHLMKDYLTSKHINRLVLYDILEDIPVMALDNQQRNLKPKEVFGDYQQFCDEISRNAVKETTIEKVGLYGGLLCIFITLLFLIGIFNNHGEIRFTADELIRYILTFIGIPMTIFIINRLSFRLEFGRYAIVIPLYALLICIMPPMLSPYLPHSIIIPIVFIGICILLTPILLYLYFHTQHKNYFSYKEAA